MSLYALHLGQIMLCVRKLAEYVAKRHNNSFFKNAGKSFVKIAYSLFRLDLSHN
jgi:hypothetical protein